MIAPHEAEYDAALLARDALAIAEWSPRTIINCRVDLEDARDALVAALAGLPPAPPAYDPRQMALPIFNGGRA